MNEFIIARFNHYHQLLVESSVIARFIVLKQNVTAIDGRIRVRATLTDEGLLEFAEYLALDRDQNILVHTYTFHWQNKAEQLIRRWDNVNHFPQLPYAPHHIHQTDGTVVENPNIPTLEMVLTEIQKSLTSRQS